ncbi:MAG: DNA-processing protein DprA [Bacteroidales bacterium]|nr:DNA-processing protein DprA [Bacteroidales bacterium]
MSDYYYELALTMLPGIGCRSARQLLDIVPSAQALFGMSVSELRQIFGQKRVIINAIREHSVFAAADKEMAFIEKNKIKILYYKDPLFPQRLNLPGCVDSPVLIFTLGNADLNPQRIVSVVGTRKATSYGLDLTRQLVDGFRGEGITVVSGLALGIDAASHQAALDNGLPTIGILAHGLNRLYPPQNRNLAKQMIARGGALLTDIRTDTPITPSMFPARNRIIASMSDATIVVEASKSGGALITANIANSYNRDLFAFPGRIGDKYSEGCNAIIAACKAMMIRNANDVFVNMGWERKSSNQGTQTTIFPKLNDDEQKVYDILAEHKEISVDEIQNFCELTLPKIAAALLSLELKNLCRCLPGKIYKLSLVSLNYC